MQQSRRTKAHPEAMTRFRRLRRSRSCARFSKTRRVDSPPLVDLGQSRGL
ncbi:unnamed protein product [Brassica oleracea]